MNGYNSSSRSINNSSSLFSDSISTNIISSALVTGSDGIIKSQSLTGDKVILSNTSGNNITTSTFTKSKLAYLDSITSLTSTDITFNNDVICTTSLTTPLIYVPSSLTITENAFYTNLLQLSSNNFILGNTGGSNPWYISLASATRNLTLKEDNSVDCYGNFSVNTNKFNVTSSSGNTSIAGTLACVGDLSINTNKFNITASSGNTSIAGTLGCVGNFSVNTNKFNITASSGNTSIAGTLGCIGNFSVNTNKFNITASSGNTSIAGTLDCLGDLSINTNKFNIISSSGNTSIAGTLACVGDLSINTNKFNITASSGNTTCAGTFGSGAITSTGSITGTDLINSSYSTSQKYLTYTDTTTKAIKQETTAYFSGTTGDLYVNSISSNIQFLLSTYYTGLTSTSGIACSSTSGTIIPIHNSPVLTAQTLVNNSGYFTINTDHSITISYVGVYKVSLKCHFHNSSTSSGTNISLSVNWSSAFTPSYNLNYIAYASAGINGSANNNNCCFSCEGIFEYATPGINFYIAFFENQGNTTTQYLNSLNIEIQRLY